MKNKKLDYINLFQYIDLIKSGVNEFKGEKKYVATGYLDTGVIHNYEWIDFQSRPSRANMEFSMNDIIFAKMKDTEKVFLIDEDSSKNIYSTGFSGLRINDFSKLMPKYVYYWLRSDDFQNLKNKNCSGTTQKAINNSKLKSFRIPIYDIELQKQIVNKLENLEKLIGYRNESLILSNMFLECLFIDYFGDLRLNNKDWEIFELKDVANIVMGQSPPGDSYNDEGVGKEFFQGKAEFGEMYPTVGKWTTEPKRIANKASILFSVRAPVGSVNIANIECCIGRGLAAIESEDKLNNLYLFYYFKIIEDTIASRGTGSTFKSINKSQLSSLKVPVPPIELQNQFADIVQQVEEIKKHQLESKLELENLFSNLMQKAFRGE